LTYHYIAAIRRLIAGGGDPSVDPDLSAYYYLLVDEYGLDLFSFEDEGGKKYI
jgi:hypothetical protein